MKRLSEHPFAISSSFLPEPSPKVLSACKACGITAMELSIGGACPGLENDKIKAYWKALIDSAAKAGITIWSAHLSFWEPYDLASLDPAVRETAVGRQLDMMQFVRDYTDAGIFVVHPSFEPLLPEKRFAHMQASKDSLRRLVEKAASIGAQIAVENLPRTCLGNSIASMAQLLSADSRLRVCFDTNHMLTDTNEAFVHAFGDKIITVHISDYDRIDERHWLPGKGVNHWNAIFQPLLAAGYDGPLLFEISDKFGDTLAQIQDAYQTLCQNFDK